MFSPNSQSPFDEVEFFEQFCSGFDEIRLTNPSNEGNEESVKNKNIIVNNSDPCITPKSQKQVQQNVKRWASVVKAQKNLLVSDSDSSSKTSDGGLKIASEISDCSLITLPKILENHKGFITAHNKLFTCKICLVDLEAVQSLLNHLKTRKHEDNVISFYKENLPVNLYSTMEFISFYGSNLCCNLCRCKINMSSHNAFETIVNILAHNSDKTHANRKADQETLNMSQNLLDSLLTTNKDIRDNAHFIEKKMNPQFKCKLCNKNIVYHENVEILEQNFSSHFNSMCHTKNRRAVEVLRLFGEGDFRGKGSFIVVNGNISCTFCECQVETDLENLIVHINGGEHAKKVLSSLEIASFKQISEKSSWLENKTNEAKVLANSNLKKGEISKKETFQQDSEKKFHTDSRLSKLLSNLPSSIEHSNCVVENDKGSLTCLICNRIVPPSTFNLKTHLLGSNHKKNKEMRNTKKIVSCLSVPGKQNNDNDHTENRNTKHSEIENLLKPLSDEIEISNFTTKNDKSDINILMNLQHKPSKKLWLKICSGCPQQTFEESLFIKKIPKVLRVYKCNKTETIPPTVLNHQFNVLLKKNTLVSDSIKFIVKNVDGKHSYCKLCKTLIPLSLDLNTLEENIVAHLKEKRHERKVSEQEQGTTAQSKCEGPNLGRVVRSLFTKVSNEKDNEQGEASKEQPNQSTETKQIKDDDAMKISEAISGEHKNSIGTNQSNETSIKSMSKHFSLPLRKIPPYFKVDGEEETNEEVLNRRQKQIDYGKNTEGYARYCEMVPQLKRGRCHPITPPKHLKCSRRTWDGMIRVWRRQLHNWDPPGTVLDLKI